MLCCRRYPQLTADFLKDLPSRFNGSGPGKNTGLFIGWEVVVVVPIYTSGGSAAEPRILGKVSFERPRRAKLRI